MPRLSQELFGRLMKSAMFSLVAYGIYFLAISLLSTHSFFLNFAQHPILYPYVPRSDNVGLFFVPYIPVFTVAFFFSLIYGIRVITSSGKLFSPGKALLFSFLMSAITTIVSVGLVFGFQGVSAGNILFGIPFHFSNLRITELFYTTISYIFYPAKLVYDLLFWFAFFIILFVVKEYLTSDMKSNGKISS